MKFIYVIVICLIQQASFSQSTRTGSTGDSTNDSASNKKIVIKYTTNSNGKVITVSYLSIKSNLSDEQLINDAKVITLLAKPVIHTLAGTRYYGTYTFYFTPQGTLLRYSQDFVFAFNGADYPTP